MKRLMPNHELQRTAAGRRGCNRRASWPPSLSLGRSAREGAAVVEMWAHHDGGDEIRTPFTPEQVKRLNQHQFHSLCHPYTCGGERRDEDYLDR